MLRQKGAHALKVNKRTNRTKSFSLSFVGLTLAEVEAFRDALRRRLSRQVKANNSRFGLVHVPGRLDWFVLFQHSWPERDLDRDLNAVATQLGIMMFIEPGIPEQEMTIDPASFFYRKWLARDRPNNG